MSVCTPSGFYYSHIVWLLVSLDFIRKKQLFKIPSSSLFCYPVLKKKKKQFGKYYLFIYFR